MWENAFLLVECKDLPKPHNKILLPKKKKRICPQHWRPGLDPWVRKIPGEGNGYPLQYSGLKNSMDRQAWQATVHGVCKVSDVTK